MSSSARTPRRSRSSTATDVQAGQPHLRPRSAVPHRPGVRAGDHRSRRRRDVPARDPVAARGRRCCAATPRSCAGSRRPRRRRCPPPTADDAPAGAPRRGRHRGRDAVGRCPVGSRLGPGVAGTLLAFLSSGCSACRRALDGARAAAGAAARGRCGWSSSPRTRASRARRGSASSRRTVDVVMSSAAWEDYTVAGRAVLRATSTARAAAWSGEGTGARAGSRSWRSCCRRARSTRRRGARRGDGDRASTTDAGGRRDRAGTPEPATRPAAASTVTRE